MKCNLSCLSHGFPLVVGLALSCCVAASLASEPRDNMPVRIISMAYLIRHSPGDFVADFLRKPGNQSIKAPFRSLYKMFPHSKGNNFHLIGKLAFVSHYCIVQPVPGFVCGDAKLNPADDGYLFVTKWIGGEKDRYLIMIIGGVSPSSTSILRMAGKKVDVLYSSFDSKNSCNVITPADWGIIAATYHVEVVNPTTFKLITGGYQGALTTEAVFKLSIDKSRCTLKLLSDNEKGA